MKTSSFKIVVTKWPCWYKLTHNSFDSMCRYAPYSKKAQHMIYSDGVEIIAHVFHPLPPPGIIILCHFFPVVCWETPVLAFGSKGIWWCTCLHIHVKKGTIHPGIATVPANTYGQITFDDDTRFMCIFNRIF